MLHDQRVGAALRRCEAAWEQALISSSELSLALVAARSARNFSRVAGHQILGAAGKAAALAGEGQSELASMHRLIERFAEVNGIEVDWAYGDGQKPPTDG